MNEVPGKRMAYIKRGRPPGVKDKERLAEICRLYEDEGFTLVRIAGHFGLTKQRIQQILKQAGIIPRYKRINFSRDVLYRLYIIERNSLSRTAKILRAGRHDVVRELARYEIERRHSSPLQIDREVLERLYISEGLTQAQAAKKLGLGTKVVQRELKRHGITFRHTPKPKIAIDASTHGTNALGIGMPPPSPN